jgi:ATP-binding cassette subfamily F protein 3
MVVSHDRALLREVCDEFWLVAHGQVLPFDGDLDDYQKWLLDTSREMARAARDAGNAKVKAKKAAIAAPAAAPASAPESGKDRKASGQARQKLAEHTKPLRNELASLERSLAAMSQEKANIEAAAAQAGVGAAQRVEQGKRLKKIAEDTEQAEARWLEITTQLDSIGSNKG